MGKIKTYHSTPQKEINIGKNATRWSETNTYILLPDHFNNTTHELFRFKRRFEIR